MCTRRMRLTRIESIDPYNWTEILNCSRSEGRKIVNRLVTDFQAGTNRFDAPGEILFVHLCSNGVVAVAGLNQEKDTSFGRAGRIRRLYVIPSSRGNGLARSLVEEIIVSASSHFDILTVNVGKLDARGFYEHLGFTPVDHPGITHTKKLAHNIMLDDTVANRAGK